MEELQTRHRKEQRDLQSQITGKKKQASKKSRKTVNDECERLERELKERQGKEISELNGEGPGGADGGEEDLSAEQLEALTLRVDGQGEDTTAAKTNGTANATAGQEDTEPTTSANSTGKKRNRQKDRLARRAAEQEALAQQASEEAANLPDMKEQERNRMLEAMTSKGLVEKEIRADGHCLYSAFADQLSQLDIPLTPNTTTPPSDKPAIQPYKLVRAQAATYIEQNSDDFIPFLEEPLPSYVHKIRDTAEWGGQLELLALAKTYGTTINVLQDFGRVEKISGGKEGQGQEGEEIWLGYYKHGFGLGEHYNSLRKEGG